MSEYDMLFQSISSAAEKVQELQDLAVTHYRPAVERIIATRSRDVGQIESVLDGLLSFCGNESALLLFRRLCRHYSEIDPAATVDYINTYREMWDSDVVEAEE